MKLSRPLIATCLALGGAGWAVWQTDAARSHPGPAYSSSPTAGDFQARPSDQIILAAHEASLGNDDDVPADWAKAGSDLLSPPPLRPGPTPPGAIPHPLPQILRPQPIKPEQRLPALPGDPVPVNMVEENPLPFSIVDMPGDQPAASGLVQSPPTERARHSGSNVRRLPPVPAGMSAVAESSLPNGIDYATTGTTEQRQTNDRPTNAATSGPADPASAQAKDGTLTVAPPPAAGQTVADQRSFPSAGPALEFSRPEPAPTEVPTPSAALLPAAALAAPPTPSAPTATAGTAPATPVNSTAASPPSEARARKTDEENPFASAAGADLRPLAELLGAGSGPAAQKEGSIGRPKTEDPPPATAARGFASPFPGSAAPSFATDGSARSTLIKQPAPNTAPATAVAADRASVPAWIRQSPTKPAIPSESAASNSVPSWAAATRDLPAASSAGALPNLPTASAPKPEAPARSALVAQSDGTTRQAMSAVLWKAEGHFQRGVALADRRAFYSARAEFLAALRLLAQGLDAQEARSARSEALARGVWAIEEADDFVPRGSGLNADVPVARLVAAHRTPVLKSSGKSTEATPLQAVQQYYTYAQEQLASAVRPSREGSQALTALGRLYSEMDLEPSHLVADGKTKGLVCQQAALLVDPSNARAANELGVLLAREGRYEESREWLRHSLRVKPQQETWHNLAAVHKGLGETQLADAAQQQSVLLARRQGQTAGSTPVVQVKQVTPAEFARSSQPGAPATVATTSTSAPQAAAKPKSSGFWSWLPWR